MVSGILTCAKVAVAIPTYNREQVLIDTLKQVFALNPPADEVLVVDQTLVHNPKTDTFLSHAHEKGKIRWIKNYPPNLPGARNRVLLETQCDIIIFIDDDVQIPTNFVSNHAQNYTNPAIAAVAGKVIQPNSLPFKYRSKPWPRLMDSMYFPLDSSERIEGICVFRGCNHSVRVDVLKAIDGYDENYIGWAFREDSDAAIRIWKSGGLIVFDPEAKLTHLMAPSGGCRIKMDEKRIPEWHISFPASYFACRHFFPTLEFWNQVILKNFRKYVLRKDTVFHPWRIPSAFVSYVYALVRAAYLAKISVKSPSFGKGDKVR